MGCKPTRSPSLMQHVVATGNMFMHVNKDFTVLDADPVLEARFGVCKGSKCYESLGYSPGVCPGCPARRVFAGERWAEFRMTVKDATGETVSLQMIATPQWDVNGDVVGCTLVVRETEAQAAESTRQCGGYDFRKLLDHLPDAVFALDSCGALTYANRSAQEFLGCEEKEILGRLFWDFVNPDHAAKAKELLSTSVGSQWDQEIAIVDTRGHEKYTRVRCAPFADSLGVVAGYEGVMRDRTPQRKLELELQEYQARLRESTHRYRQLLEEVPDIIFSMDTDGRFTFVNPQVEELLGYTVDQFLGTSLSDHVSFQDSSLVKTISSIEPGSVWDEEISVLARDGSSKWVRIRCRPVCDEKDRIIEYEGVLRDRSSRKKLEDDLKASKVELLEKINIIDELYEHIVQSEKSRAIAEHTAEVAHELRQPLTVIGGFARRMYRQIQSCKRLDPASQEECFAIILKEVGRLEHILGGLIDFTRLKSINKQRVDPNSLIEEVLHIYQERFQEKDVRLELDLGGEIGEVMLDPDRFQQVVRNLVSNALEASRQHGMIRVETSLLVPSDKAQITGELDAEVHFEFKIRNGGKRIQPDQLRKIFDPFYTTKDRGTGIGLSLVKRIVEEHGGSISGKSDEKGTVFTVWIPLHHSMAENNLEAKKSRRHAGSAPGATGNTPHIG